MIDQEIEMFSELNLELAGKITEKARQFLAENIALKNENLRLKERIAELEILALKTEGLSFRNLADKCGIFQPDDFTSHKIVTDLFKAVKNGQLPNDTILSPKLYKYSIKLEQWLKEHPESNHNPF